MGATMHPVLSEYVKRAGFGEARSRRMINGLRVLREIAAKGDQPITYAAFAEMLQPGLAPLATGAILEDIGVFCNRAGWPNVTCFVISATSGECSEGFTKVSSPGLHGERCRCGALPGASPARARMARTLAGARRG
ncbi:hypothetical protein GCM10023322_46600 [Rugosimonospora acidiphila]|uniref:Uncharacterized protein n=1 Tax=Rugosimonospora acidiphila TaxID=556531 RepID=A0ABP9S316_9ACTN